MSEPSQFITYNGETKLAKVWAEELGMNEQTLLDRINKLGWSVSAALTAPVNHKRLITYQGKTQNLTAWSKELGIHCGTLYSRIFVRKWAIKKAFSTPAAPYCREQPKPIVKPTLREVLGL